MRYILLSVVFTLIAVSSVSAQISVMEHPSTSSVDVSLRVLPHMVFSEPIEDINGNDIVSSGAAANQINVRDLITFIGDGQNINFTASINSEDDRIEITPQGLLQPNISYTIAINDIRKKDTDSDTLDIFTYTFETGSAAEVSTVGSASNICTGDPEGA